MNITYGSDARELKNYYKKHASIYDATRWSFLFGREDIITLSKRQILPQSILEVGCGTGTNLISLTNNFPDAQISGIDLSEDMLVIAKNKIKSVSERVTLTNHKYDKPLKNHLGEAEKFDVIIFSYALTMFNPGWDVAIKVAREQLNENGVIAVVDFHHSRFEHFRRWMGINHVRMESHILPVLEKEFYPVISRVTDAYKGLWQYFSFIGRKKNEI